MKYPDEFAFGKKCGQRVLTFVADNCPTLPKDLPNICEDNKLTLLISASELTPEQKKKIYPGGVSHWLAKKVPTKELATLDRKSVV